MQQLEEIKGIVEKFLFQNNENGFAIFIVKINSKETITAKGFLSNIQAGQDVFLYGKWIFHSKFGRQFDVEKFTCSTPTTSSGLKKYLGSGMIKGVGKVYAQKLVDHFGTSILDVIENDPQSLSKVSGIGQNASSKLHSLGKAKKKYQR